MSRRILALCGSLRKGSTNAALLAAAKAAATSLQDDIEIQIEPDLSLLPHFNPDLDRAGYAPVVAEFRARVRGAEAILISTPEYAHGVPGVLKNALDWLVSEDDFAGKPVGLIYGSAGDASFAHEALVEVLKTMSAVVVQEAVVSVVGVRSKITVSGEIQDPEILDRLRSAVKALARSKQI